MRITQFKTNFTSGELDPLLLGRTDLQQYNNGLQRAKNITIQPQGGFRRRDGLRFIRDFTGFTDFRLIPFEYSTTDSYLLVLVAGRIYVFKAGVLQTNINGSGNDYITATGLTAAMLSELDYTQAVDTLIICHEDLQTKRLVRNSDTSWTWQNLPLTNVPQYAFTLSTSSPAYTITPSAVSGSITITAGSASFTSANVGDYVQVLSGFGRARFVEYVSTTVMRAVTEVPFFDTSAIASGDWELESGYEDTWSATRGWPRSATFHQGRLYFGGSKTRTNTIWGSRVIDYFNFDPGTGLDDEAVEATLSTNQYNSINKIASQSDLRIFTSGGEFIISNAQGSPITPSSLLVQPQTRSGSKPGVPIEDLNGASIFVQRGGNAINAFQYTDTVAGYQNTPLSVLSSHLIKDPVDLAVRRGTSTDETDSLYVVNGTDGSLVCYSVLATQGVIAASEYTTGVDETDQFVAVAVEIDTIYVVVKRTVNGATKYFLERFESDLLLDSAVASTSPGGATTVDVNHLPNTQVEIIVDGTVQPAQTVPSSSPYTLTLATAADDSYQVGINFIIEARTMPAEPNMSSGTVQGVQKRILQVDVIVNETQSLTVNSYNIPFLSFPYNVLDVAIVPYTGRKTLHGIPGYGNSGQVTISQNYPLKLNVLAVEYRMSLGD